MSASLHIGRFAPRSLGRALRRVERLRTLPGLVDVRPVTLARFETTFGGTPTPLRWGLWCGWADDAARDAGWETTARFADGADEAWSVALETVRVVQGGLGGWAPATDGAAKLTREEPLAVITYGRLAPRHLWNFTVNNQRVYKELSTAPGLGMHVGLVDHPMTRATFSLWRNQGEMVRATYGPSTVHNPVQKRALEVPWADDWFFARFRPVASVGSWGGVDPLSSFAYAA